MTAVSENRIRKIMRLDAQRIYDEAAAEHGEPFVEYVDEVLGMEYFLSSGNPDGLVTGYEDSYVGQYADIAEYARDYASEIVPELVNYDLFQYIDFEAYGRGPDKRIL